MCLGGAVGTGARYALGGWVQRLAGAAFPAGTLVVNVLGSLLITVIMTLGAERGLIPAQTRIVLTTGVMGGFTTFSTFSYETLRLLQDGALLRAALNALATVLACLGAAALGVVMARELG